MVWKNNSKKACRRGGIEEPGRYKKICNAKVRQRTFKAEAIVSTEAWRLEKQCIWKELGGDKLGR